MVRKAAVLSGLVLLVACGGGEKKRHSEFVGAVTLGDTARVRQLLEADPLLITAVDETNGRFVRPLHEAIRNRNVPMVRLLLDKGVAPNSPEADGLTPVRQWLRTDRNPEILDLLAARKADLEAPDAFGRHLLHQVVEMKDVPELVDLFLDHGAKVDPRDAEGLTPLLAAAASGSHHTAAPLCARGADLTARTSAGDDAARLVERAKGSGEGEAAKRFFGPDGGCAQLGALFRKSGPILEPTRRAIVYDSDCLSGDMYACGELGSQYDRGEGVPVDLLKAVELFTKACQAGRSWSCGKLAYRLENGRGTPRDILGAVTLYRKACEGHEGWCCNNLGILYEQGDGVRKDAEKAVTYYRMGCSSGDFGACASLGHAYATGEGVPRDLGAARVLLEKACAGKDVHGCRWLAELQGPRAAGP